MRFPKPNEPAPVSELVAELPDGRKIKRRIERMRACNELNAKGKLCQGHLKRWNDFGPDVAKRGDEVYRCERCHTIYLPNLIETARTRTLSW